MCCRRPGTVNQEDNIVAIDNITGAPATTPTTPSQGTTSGTNNATKALDKDAFLNLLVTQLQHQDPTQPQADGEFIAQLATFSSLEQLQQMNQTLGTIAQFFQAVQDSTASGQTEGKV